MRIRKQAKLAGLIFSSATSSASAYPSPPTSRICHLNQSPWDAISFPPDSDSSPYQVDGEDSFTANGSLGDSFGAAESVASMKTNAEEVDKARNTPNNDRKEMKDAEEVDKAARGHFLLEHHLVRVRNSNGLAQHAGEKSDTPTAEKADAIIPRRGRPKKSAAAAAIPGKADPVPRHHVRPKKAAPAAAASNPYEFYYYSGFGPSWGKKRGGNNGTKFDENVELNVSENTPSTCRIAEEEIIDYIEVDDDYDDEDDDENVEEGGEFGRKRGRKPIKARSLKSLM